MIFEALFEVYYSIVELFIACIPTVLVALPQEFVGGLLGLVELLGGISFLIPVSCLVVCIGAMLHMYMLQLLFAVFNWGIRKLPGIS